MTDVQAILFDLDDTLYEELSYVRSGMAAVAPAIAAEAGVSVEIVSQRLLTLLTESGRQETFDRALPLFGLYPTAKRINHLVETYRTHRPKITMYPGVLEMLVRLRPLFRLAVVTDGLLLMQRNKVAALGLADLVDVVSYSWEIDRPKPSPQSYLVALEKMGCVPQQGLIVGDNPAHDMLAAAAIPMRAVRVRTGRFSLLSNPPGADIWADIRTVTDLVDRL